MSEMNIINIKREISDELIEHVLCCAFEGGITYWSNNVSCEDNKDMKKVSGWKHEYLTKTKKKDAVMYIHDLESEEKYPITKKSIIDALQKMDNFNNYRQALDRILNETYDADDADIMVQIACFKEVIYG
jgi:hypothetical protein